jgi:replicative DNA helicase
MINDKNTSNTEFIESVEDKLISIFLNNNNSAEKGVAYLEPKDFFKQENSAIFSVIKDLIGKTKTIDDLTVLSYFDANKNFQFLDYKTYINKLISLAPSTMALEEYIDIVKKASIKRGLDKVCGEIIKSNFNFVNFDKEIEKDVKEFNEIV